MKTEREQWMRNVKGTYDYLPDEQIERNRVIDVLRQNFESYGFNPIETPILCMEDVLASKYAGGAEIMKEVYTLSDQGERELGLRYDLTVPFAKCIGLNKNKINYPFKKYEIGKAYRNGPIKRGRKREFIQADVDVVGVKSILAESEFFRMIKRISKELDLKVVVKYNDRRVLKTLLNGYLIDDVLANSIILTIDKVEKMTREDVLNELGEKGISSEVGNEILDIISSNLNEQIVSIVEIEELKDFKELIDFANKLNDENIRFEFTPSLARGLEVYTGAIWEVFINEPKSEITSSIGAGGRYDNIIGKLLDEEMKYPAVGMTFGVDVLMEGLRDKGKWIKKSVVDYLIVPLPTSEKVVDLLSEKLRDIGIKVEVDYSGKRVKKVLNRANKLEIPYVSIVGEDEVIADEVRVKDMKTGVEKTFKLDDVEGIYKMIYY